MRNVIPDVLAPYLSHGPAGSLILITSLIDAPAPWLLTRFVHAALYDDEAFGGDAHVKVIFVSILRSLDLWRELGKKIGLDFPSLIKSNRLAYVSGLGDVADGVNALDLATQDTTSHLARLHDTVIRQTSPKEDSVSSETRPVLIIDGLDFLLDSRPSLPVLQVSQLVLALRQHVHSTVITASADFPLLQNSSAFATPMETGHRALVTSLAHQSRQVIQTRVLETGAAEDITGVLRVSAGGDLGEEPGGLEDGEWLYKVKGDGSVRVWRRGE